MVNIENGGVWSAEKNDGLLHKRQKIDRTGLFAQSWQDDDDDEIKLSILVIQAYC